MYAALYRHDVAKELRGDNLGDGKPIRAFSTSVDHLLVFSLNVSRYTSQYTASSTSGFEETSQAPTAPEKGGVRAWDKRLPLAVDPERVEMLAGGPGIILKAGQSHVLRSSEMLYQVSR